MRTLPGNRHVQLAGSIHTTASGYSQHRRTDPTKAASYLRVDDITSDGSTTITFSAISNRTYTLLFKDVLSEPAWNRLADTPARSTNWTAQIIDILSPAHRFYRIVTPKQE